MLGDDEPLTSPRWRRDRVIPALLGLVLAGLVLSGCTGPTTQVAEPSTTAPSTSPTALSTSATTPPAAAPPQVGDCHQLAFTDLTQPTNSAPVVGCSSDHTSVTVAVLRHRSPDQVNAITDACTKAVRRHIGATDLQLATTMIQTVWFLPDSPTSGWVRCDMVLYASSGKLAPLPRKTANWWKRHRSDIGTCGTSAPGTAGFKRVLCGPGTPWRVLVALAVGGKAYPGVKALRTQADLRCSDAVRLASNLALKYAYGFEWPTKDQWRSGNHHLLCWMKR